MLTRFLPTLEIPSSRFNSTIVKEAFRNPQYNPNSINSNCRYIIGGRRISAGRNVVSQNNLTDGFQVFRSRQILINFANNPITKM
jgi:hypothetical protein